MALLNLGEDPWLLEYDSCEKLSRDIMEQLNTRYTLSRNTDKYSQLSANIRLRLKQYKNEVAQLSQKLAITTKSGSITDAESERRTRQLEVLHSKGIQMQRIFDEQVVSKAKEDRENLLGNATNSQWGESSNSTVDNFDIRRIREQQTRIIGEQNEGLESLSQIIARQKNIASNISNEVDRHNEILDDLGDHMDKTDVRVRTETQHVTIVDRKDNTCAYWVVIILLFLSIIIVAII